MGTNSAQSLFAQNIGSAEQCLQLYGAINMLSPELNVSWILRAAVVFAISALDAYFHDKIRYRAGTLYQQDVPADLARFNVPLGDLPRWDKAKRKGNVVRNWLITHYSTRPLQRKEDVAEALKVVGIENLWATIEPDTPSRDQLLQRLAQYVDRRNKIAHEGDRLAHRSSGKKLRSMDCAFAQGCIEFVVDLVDRIERHFPR